MFAHCFVRTRARVAALLAGVLLVGATSAALADSAPTIRVGWTIPAEEAKYLMMRHPEMFPNLGKVYQVDWVQFQGTAPMIQAMLAGALECTTMAPISLAQGAVQGGLQAYIVAQHAEEKKGSFSVYWAVKDDSPIKTPADLKGKKIGTNAYGTSVYYDLALWLKQHGLDPQRDVQIVETGFAPAETALRSGRIDAAPLVQPFAGRAEQKGGVRKLFSLDAVQSPLVHVFEGCGKSYTDAHPAVIKAYVHDLSTAMDKVLHDRQLGIEVDQAVMRVPKPVLESFALSPKDFYRTAGAAPDLASIQQSFDLFYHAGFVSKPLKVDDFVRRDVMAPQ